MPRSRTTSPTPLSPDISNSFVPGLTLTLSSPPESPQHRNVMENSSSSSPAAREHVHKKHKYMPPRIGTSFQAQIEPFDSELAKSTIQLRQEGIQNGLGGYHSYSKNDGNTTNVMSGEYGVNGGLFASTTNTTNDNNSGYASSNVGRRKKAGRPPKSGKGNGKGKKQAIAFGVVVGRRFHRRFVRRSTTESTCLLCFSSGFTYT